MSTDLGVLVFARYNSNRLPGKALRTLGGIPLLERVLRRAQLLPWPVCLATTDKRSDDAVVELAENLDVRVFRGSEERVLERGVLAAEAFGLDAFARLCGDRPLFPVDTMRSAFVAMQEQSGPSSGPDLVTSYRAGSAVRGLTTEVVRTTALRRILDRGVSAAHQEHLTMYFYENPEEFRILEIPSPPAHYRCPGFAVDTEVDVMNLNRIFGVCPAIDLTVSEADRIFHS